MPQNIYDREEFFAGYGTLPRSREGLAGAPEWPALRALLPELRGARVLDLGCGFGWFARHARERGAAHVLGLELSGRMLERARSMGEDPAIEYRRADLESVDLPEGGFDLAFSSLVLHYIADLGGLLAKVSRALVPGGSLVVSMEHPIFMAPSQPGWRIGEGRPVWPLDGYFREGERVTDWFTPGVVKQHRTLGSTLNLMMGAGFRLAHVEEWCPTDAQIAAEPDWEKERERPMFLLIAARKA
ncbi:class I SAM-dependent methyltransferase [Roseococcus sp. SYP-B2431]|uniref:class I SAM-dependent methyltransferase n=1 Tax=Roseococcus sp. SYP-B2431 TaxID=2496640 RepID=UPI00103953E8|nr:class I SAM-dependent methyltransferase [Roseococcus sp. SYP-B2431]TCH99626.1 class I SAM-dependent methyltransferase [Roseococcus sp. SYP-B2431]